MVNMTINKQITIIITGPKPVVSSKLIYDELGLRFLGTGEWGRRGGYCLHHRAQNGVKPAFPRDRSPGPGSPGEVPRRLSPPCASQLSSPCPLQLSFLDTLLAFLIQFILLKFIQRIYAYEIII